ncbi:hypothetical protein F2Q70_00030425 [Brassica cretica]|uniref:Uncharacterized protein n=1 Tax=Brassica cretica TaxID=69181 RepID=A0A8S9FPW0_BRACR|nr:hypothetical protein F2Q70_00030425 [Brassica cretica]KAF3591821.1 hypothetical protein DY000_02022955 [Brassica cretica]
MCSWGKIRLLGGFSFLELGRRFRRLRAVCSSLRCPGSAACGLWLVSSFNVEFVFKISVDEGS